MKMNLLMTKLFVLLMFTSFLSGCFTAMKIGFDAPLNFNTVTYKRNSVAPANRTEQTYVKIEVESRAFNINNKNDSKAQEQYANVLESGHKKYFKATPYLDLCSDASVIFKEKQVSLIKMSQDYTSAAGENVDTTKWPIIFLASIDNEKNVTSGITDASEAGCQVVNKSCLVLNYTPLSAITGNEFKFNYSEISFSETSIDKEDVKNLIEIIETASGVTSLGISDKLVESSVNFTNKYLKKSKGLVSSKAIAVGEHDTQEYYLPFQLDRDEEDTDGMIKYDLLSFIVVSKFYVQSLYTDETNGTLPIYKNLNLNISDKIIGDKIRTIVKKYSATINNNDASKVNEWVKLFYDEISYSGAGLNDYDTAYTIYKTMFENGFGPDKIAEVRIREQGKLDTVINDLKKCGLSLSSIEESRNRIKEGRSASIYGNSTELKQIDADLKTKLNTIRQKISISEKYDLIRLETSKKQFFSIVHAYTELGDDLRKRKNIVANLKNLVGRTCDNSTKLSSNELKTIKELVETRRAKELYYPYKICNIQGINNPKASEVVDLFFRCIKGNDLNRYNKIFSDKIKITKENLIQDKSFYRESMIITADGNSTINKLNNIEVGRHGCFVSTNEKNSGGVSLTDIISEPSNSYTYVVKSKSGQDLALLTLRIVDDGHNNYLIDYISLRNANKAYIPFIKEHPMDSKCKSKGLYNDYVSYFE